MLFLFATFQHCIIGLVVAHMGPEIKMAHLPITTFRKMSWVLLHFYVICIGTLMFFFSLFHWWLALTNTTTNEKLRGVYSKKKNPWNLKICENFTLYWSDYPETPSNAFDNQEMLVSNEEKFYYTILKRYGKLMYVRNDQDSEPTQYVLNQDVSMFDPDGNIAMSNGESMA